MINVLDFILKHYNSNTHSTHNYTVSSLRKSCLHLERDQSEEADSDCCKHTRRRVKRKR